MPNVLIAGVTGGIGMALARHMLDVDEEVKIWGIARRTAAAASLTRDYGSRVTLLDADLTQQAALASALPTWLPAGMPLHQLVYAAGVLHDVTMHPEKRIEDIDATQLEKSFSVNALGMLFLVQASLPWLSHQEMKQVVAISAKVGSVSDNHLGGWYGYRMAKAALNMAVRNLSVELPRRLKPVVCVALHPGTTLTSLSQPFSRSLAKLKVHSPGETADNLYRILQHLSEKDNGSFLNWDGQKLPW